MLAESRLHATLCTIVRSKCEQCRMWPLPRKAWTTWMRTFTWVQFVCSSVREWMIQYMLLGIGWRVRLRRTRMGGPECLHRQVDIDLLYGRLRTLRAVATPVGGGTAFARVRHHAQTFEIGLFYGFSESGKDFNCPCECVWLCILAEVLVFFRFE